MSGATSPAPLTLGLRALEAVFGGEARHLDHAFQTYVDHGVLDCAEEVVEVLEVGEHG